VHLALVDIDVIDLLLQPDDRRAVAEPLYAVRCEIRRARCALLMRHPQRRERAQVIARGLIGRHPRGARPRHDRADQARRAAIIAHVDRDAESDRGHIGGWLHVRRR
jgi:hypothetical protein